MKNPTIENMNSGVVHALGSPVGRIKAAILPGFRYTACGIGISRYSTNFGSTHYDRKVTCERCLAAAKLEGDVPAKYMRNLTTGAVHRLTFSSAMYSTCACGHEIDGGSLNYERLYGNNHKVTCKTCLADMEDPSKSLMERTHNEVELKKATVMDGKDIFYEIRVKDGTHEFIFDTMSAQEAAEQFCDAYGYKMSDIECIHKLAVVKVIFPTMTVKFEE